MRERLGWERIEDAGKLIGLLDAVGGAALSLEPGGQFELSGAPLTTVHEIADELDAHLRCAHAVGDSLGIGFLALGVSPKWSFAETPVMPKSRYRIMARYMPRVGTRGLDMMFRTATAQTNFDFSDEADMVAKLRVGLALQPVITALFANSPFTDGALNGLLSARSEIWRHTDGARTGMLPFAFEPGMGFERYVDYALDVPLYFVKRDGIYHEVAGRELSRSARRPAQSAAGRARDGFRLGQPSLDDLSRSAPQALPRNARRGRRPRRSRLRVGGVDGRPQLRSPSPRRRRRSRARLERGRAPDPARRGSAPRAGRRASPAATCARSRARRSPSRAADWRGARDATRRAATNRSI